MINLDLKLQILSANSDSEADKDLGDTRSGLRERQGGGGTFFEDGDDTNVLFFCFLVNDGIGGTGGFAFDALGGGAGFDFGGVGGGFGVGVPVVDKDVEDES